MPRGCTGEVGSSGGVGVGEGCPRRFGLGVDPPVQWPLVALVLFATDPLLPDRSSCGVYVREWSARGGAGPPDLAPDDSIAGRRRGGRRSNAARAMPALPRSPIQRAQSLPDRRRVSCMRRLAGGRDEAIPGPRWSTDALPRVPLDA